jgi:Immunoglobulin-like domain of bacterial spore germination/Sporulation and spore germination
MITISRRVSVLMASLAILASLAACSPGSGEVGPVATPPPTTEPSMAIPSPEPTGGGVPTATPDGSGGPLPSAPGATTTVRAYFFLGSFTHPAGLAPVLREIPATPAVGTAAMTALLAGPSDAEMGTRPAMYTTVPDQTRLLGLTIANGTAVVNLSREFESGGGSASIVGRLAQVVYTLTQFPSVQRVSFELDGQPVTVFSTEGVVLDHPVGRADYADQVPAIFVDRPAWGAAIGNPARVTGLANVFEATFNVALIDEAGATLADKPVMATCGTGCWGTFDVTIPYSVGVAQSGLLRVYDRSARDGSMENVTEYPVWLTPSG